jgi:hypothetical protein
MNQMLKTERHLSCQRGNSICRFNDNSLSWRLLWGLSGTRVYSLYLITNETVLSKKKNCVTERRHLLLIKGERHWKRNQRNRSIEIGSQTKKITIDSCCQERNLSWIWFTYPNAHLENHWWFNRHMENEILGICMSRHYHDHLKF